MANEIPTSELVRAERPEVQREIERLRKQLGVQAMALTLMATEMLFTEGGPSAATEPLVNARVREFTDRAIHLLAGAKASA